MTIDQKASQQWSKFDQKSSFLKWLLSYVRSSTKRYNLIFLSIIYLWELVTRKEKKS